MTHSEVKLHLSYSNNRSNLELPVTVARILAWVQFGFYTNNYFVLRKQNLLFLISPWIIQSNPEDEIPILIVEE